MFIDLIERTRPLRQLPLAVRYLLTALIVAAFVGLRLALLRLDNSIADLPLLMMCLPAVIVSALLFDRGSGFLAVFLSAAASAVAFGSDSLPALPPRVALLRLVVFLIAGLFTAAVIEAMRRAVETLAAKSAELEAARSLLDSVIDATPEPIYVKDREGRYVLANSATAAVMGVQRASVTGKHDREFFDEPTLGALMRTDAALLTTGRSITLEETIARSNEPPRTFLSTKAPWRDAAGKIIGLVGVSRDIEERKQTEDRLRAADAQKTVLLADINHRVKNHLQTVSGLLDTAARRSESLDEAKAALGAGANRLSVLGRVYARLLPGATASVIGAKGFIEELCADLKTSLVDGRAVAVRVDAQPDEIESSRAALVGLIVNELVQNALKYAFPDDRAGTVCVFFQREGDNFRLRVHDDGVGMADQARRGSGTRLVRALAQQLGGSAEWQGPPGTDVTVVFPAEDREIRL